jgi:hypothetical protein
MDSKEKQGFDQTLESAIVVSWADLMRGSPAGLIHIEYGFNTTGTVDYLKVLSSVSSVTGWLRASIGCWDPRLTLPGLVSRMDMNRERWLAFCKV